MRRIARLAVGLISIALMLAQSKSPFAGTWEGQMNDQPAVELTIDDTAGTISGSIGFYLQLRGEDGKWHAKDKYVEPLLATQTHGKILTFEVRHHKKHGSPEFGPNVKFVMEVTGTSEANLRQADDSSDAVGLKLNRRS
jgi:hypothetical protein